MPENLKIPNTIIKCNSQVFMLKNKPPIRSLTTTIETTTVDIPTVYNYHGYECKCSRKGQRCLYQRSIKDTNWCRGSHTQAQTERR